MVNQVATQFFRIYSTVKHFSSYDEDVYNSVRTDKDNINGKNYCSVSENTTLVEDVVKITHFVVHKVFQVHADCEVFNHDIWH